MLKKIVRRLLWIIGVPLVVIILVLGYLGFIPGVSAMFGSDKPVDLGVAPSDGDRISAIQKFEQEFVDPSSVSAFDILKAAETQSIDSSFTQREIAAHVMETHPVSDLQIKFHVDGSFEAAGKLDKGRITAMIDALGFSNLDKLDILATVNKYLPGSPTVYLKGTGSVTNEQAELELTEAKVGRLPVATGPFAEGLVAYANAIMQQVPHFDVSSLMIEDGQAHYVGTAPSVVPTY